MFQNLEIICLNDCFLWWVIFVMDNSFDIIKADQHGLNLWFWHVCFFGLGDPGLFRWRLWRSGIFGSYWKTQVSSSPVTILFPKGWVLPKPFLKGLNKFLLSVCSAWWNFSTILAQTFFMFRFLVKFNLTISLFMFYSSAIFWTVNWQSLLAIWVTFSTFGLVLEDARQPGWSSSSTSSLPS